MESDMVQREVEEKQYIKGLVMDVIKTRCYTVKDVIGYIKGKDKSIDDNYIKDTIRELVKDKKIELEEPKFDGSFKDFIFSMNTLFTLWLTIIVTSITLSAIYLLPQEPFSMVRIVVGGIFVLFIPGYALINLLFPKMTDIIERVALSIGLSLAIVSLVGLILNYIPLGIRLDPVVSILSIISICMMFIASYKRYEARRHG